MSEEVSAHPRRISGFGSTADVSDSPPPMLMGATCHLCAANATRAVRAAGRNRAPAGATNALVRCFVPWQLAASPRSLSFISLLRFDWYRLWLSTPWLPAQSPPYGGVTADVRDCATRRRTILRVNSPEPSIKAPSLLICLSDVSNSERLNCGGSSPMGPGPPSAATPSSLRRLDRPRWPVLSGTH